MSRQNTTHALVLNCLTKALFSLMKTKKLNEITITELTNKAGVSRISFYRNFDYIEDILIDYLSGDLTDWWIDYTSKTADTEQFWESLFERLRKHEKELKLIYKSNASYILKDIIFASCGPKKEYDDKEAFKMAMLAGLIFGYVDEWIKRGMVVYPEYPSVKNILKEVYKY